MNDDKGKRLKTVRKAAGLSQQRLGERLGVDQAFLSRVENGAVMYRVMCKTIFG